MRDARRTRGAACRPRGRAAPASARYGRPSDTVQEKVREIHAFAYDAFNEVIPTAPRPARRVFFRCPPRGTPHQACVVTHVWALNQRIMPSAALPQNVKPRAGDMPALIAAARSASLDHFPTAAFTMRRPSSSVVNRGALDHYLVCGLTAVCPNEVAFGVQSFPAAQVQPRFPRITSRYRSQPSRASQNHSPE